MGNKFVLTPSKRRLGQGNIFTHVSDSVLKRGGAVPGGYGPTGVPHPGQIALSQGGLAVPGGMMVETPPTATAPGGTHATSMDSCYSWCVPKGVVIFRIQRGWHNSVLLMVYIVFSGVHFSQHFIFRGMCFYPTE